MAIDNTNFSDLGSELPSEENIQPWSGEGLSKDPIINFPEYSSLPGVDIRENYIGNPDLPNADGIPSQIYAVDYVLNSQRALDADIKKNNYGKIFTYDAGPDGNSFYDRYAAYGEEKFAEVGFSPFRNNEANFNANTTMWDDWKRMLGHSMPTLFKRGFIDGPKSFAKLITGDVTGTDLEDAEEYARAAAIGQSSKGGVSAFMNNTVMNFGYTAGIITEAIAEEVAMTLVTGMTGGATAGAQAVRTGMLLNRIGKGLGKFGSGAKAMKNLFTVAKSPANAQRFWKATRSPVGRVLNPLENTLETISSFSKASKTGADLTKLAKVSKTAGSLYRDARNINMAISEARLEAGMVENDIYKELNANYMRDNDGEAPDEQTQKNFRQLAKKGSLETFWGNAGFIYVTNKITFNNITSPKGGIRNFLTETRKELFDVGNQTGKFGRLGRVVYDKSKKAFEFEKNNLRGLAKSWWKQPGFATAKKTLGYFKSNVSEGLQENIQEIISRANKKHYVEAYNTESVSAALYGRGVSSQNFAAGSVGSTPWDTYMDEASKEFSGTGFETFMSGFMMGTLSGPFNAAMPFLTTQYNRMFQKDEYAKWKEMKMKATNDVVNRLNEISDPKQGNLKSMLDSHIVNMGTQDAVSDIQRYGTKKEALDASDEAFIKSVHTMRESNSTDVFVDMLDSMKELTDAELADAVGSISVEDAPKYRERIDRAINKIKNIEEAFKDAEKRFPNPVDLTKAKQEAVTEEEFKAQKALHDAWNLSVYNYVFFNQSFKDAQQRMNSINQEYLKDEALKNLDYTAAKVLFDPQMARQQASILAKELEAAQELESQFPGEKEQKIASIKRQQRALEQFIGFYSQFDAFYNRDTRAGRAIEILKQEGIENPTEEQIAERIDKELGELTNETEQAKIIRGLKIAHDEYINSLAGRNISPFQETLDNAFTQLLDYYKLDQESRKMVEFINILHDPGAFIELVRENQKIELEIQQEKDALNRKIVDSEVDKVELNTLLNDLQSLNLQLEIDQLIEFIKDKVVPGYFVDAFTGKKYYADTPQYREGLNLIMQKQELSRMKTASIDPATGAEMTPQMKESVERALGLVFNESPLYVDLQNGLNYTKGKDRYLRVSEAINQQIGDGGFSEFPDVLTNDNSIFNLVFNNAVWNGERYVNQEFEFTQEKIEEFINELEKFGDTSSSKAINKSTIDKVRNELTSFLNNEVLASKQAQIDKLKQELELTDVNNRSLIEAQIAELESTANIEINKNNLQGIVADLLPRVTYEAGRERGNTLDDLLRDFFDPTTTEMKFDEKRITKKAFDNLFGPDGYLQELKQLQLAGEIYILSKNLTLGDNNLIGADGKKLDNVAGTLDLLIIDKEGNEYIVDLKTAVQDQWPKYTEPGSKRYSKFFRNSIQQLSYRNLYFNKSGRTPRAFILPIGVEEDANGKVLDASRPPEGAFKGQDSLFTEDPMFIEVTEDVAIEKNGVVITGDIVNSFVPKKGEVVLEVDEEGNLVPKKKPKVKTDFEIFNEDRMARKNQAIQDIRLTESELGFRNLETYYKDVRGKIVRLVEPLIERDRKTGKIIVDQEPSKKKIKEARNILLDRLKSISAYEKTDYGREDKIASTFDNLTGKAVSAYIGKVPNQDWRYGMPKEEQFTDEPMETTVSIDSVYLNEDGNYVIIATNMRTGKEYDAIITPDGDVIRYVREGKIQDIKGIDDKFFLPSDTTVRPKTQEEIDAEKPVEETLPEGFRYVEEGEVIPAGNYITRLSVDGKRTITNAPAGGAPAVSANTTTVRLKPEQFVSNETLPADIQGMIIYATPGSGKTAYINEQENPNLIDADDILVELITSVGFRPIGKTEAPQKYIESFVFSDEGRATGYTKADIDKMALEAMEKLAAEGKTIFTGTKALIPSVDFLILAPSNHIGVKDRFGSEQVILNFKAQEDKLVKLFGTSRTSNTAYESLYDRIQTENDTLNLYKELDAQKKDLTTEEMVKLRSDLDERASILLNPTDTKYINTNDIVTFINDNTKLKIQSGQEMKVIAIDAVNKKVIVKKSGLGNFKNINMDYQDYLDAIDTTSTEEVPEGVDDETTSYVSGALADNEKLDKLDKKDDDHNDYLDESNDEDIFGC
jgi:hypothetical protein